MKNTRDHRHSGVELYKIMAMYFIVGCHVVHTIGQYSADYTVYNSMILDLRYPSNNIQQLLLVFMWNAGWCAVDMFFVASAWFMCESKKVRGNRIAALLGNVWVISVLFLIVYWLCNFPVSAKLIIKSFLPNIFGNNWYITCYVILYLIHPVLNEVIDGMDRKKHFWVAVTGLCFYCTITYGSEFLLFYSKVIIFVIIYFVVAYIRKYCIDRSNDIRLNLRLFIAAFLANAAVICAVNYFGSRISILNDKVLHSNCIENPFLILISISMFNIFRQIKMKSHVVNYISSLTLYIYIIHENILFRTYTRTAIWNSLLNRYGYDRILLCAVGFTFVLFLASLGVSTIYDIVLRPSADKMVNRIYGYFQNKISRMEF